MSQGNENAQPTPVDQTTQVTTPAETPPTPAPELTDPDLIELRDAQAAVTAEEAATGTQGTQQANGTPAPQAPPAAAQPGQQPPPAAPAAKVPMVPKPRLDQVLRERDEALQQAAYHRGVAEARAPAGQPPGQQQQPPAPQTPEQRLAGITNEIEALSKKFDDGEITMVDFKRQERGLQARERAIHEEAAPRPKGGEGGDTLYLEDVTTQLLGQHPWVNVFDQVGTPKDWKYLEDTARERIAERGVELASGALGSATLRREMAAVADELGPILLAPRAQARGLLLPGQQARQVAPPQQQQQTKPPLTVVAQNRLDKITQQGNAPPNLSAMQGNNGMGGVTEAQIDSMSDEAIAALPNSIRNKFLGKTA